MISVLDKNDEKDIERIQFSTTEEMANKLKTLAKTKDPKINYVDIFLQVPFQQVRFLKKMNNITIHYSLPPTLF